MCVFNCAFYSPIKSVTSKVTLEGSNLYANGNSIVLEKDNDGLIYVFDENHNKLLDQSVSAYLTIYGGSKNKDVEGNINITIKNATYSYIYGGGYSDGTASANVTGNINISVIGKTDANSLYGGGRAISDKGNAEANVNGSINISITATPTSNHGNITGGGYAYAYNSRTSYAKVMGNISTYITGRSYSLRGGGSASSKETTSYANADVDGNITNIANSVDIRELYGAGYANVNASANAYNVSNLILNQSEIMILEGSGHASGSKSTADVLNVLNSLEDCINIYGYVIGGGYANDGASATAQNVTLSINNSIIPADTQFGSVVAAGIYGGGWAYKADSDASVNSVSLAITNTETCGSIYGGGEASEGANASVNSIVSNFENNYGTEFEGAMYYSAVIAGGSYRDQDSSIIVRNSVMNINNCEFEHIWGGAEESGNPHPTSENSELVLNGTIKTDTITCFDTITLNSELPLQLKMALGKDFSSATKIIADTHLAVGTTLITSEDSDDVQDLFTLDNGKMDYEIKDNVSHWKVGQVTYTISTENNEGGTITKSKTVNRFTDYEVSWKADEKYEVYMIFIDGKELSTNNTSYTFENIDSDHSVKVIFKKSTESGVIVDKNPDPSVPEVKPNITKEEEKQLLTEEDKQLILEGKTISFGVSVDTITMVPTAAKIEIEKVVDKENVLLNLDISMYKKIDSDKTNITQTNIPVSISVDIPNDFVKESKGRSFAIIRTHENEDGTFTSTILKDLDNDPDTVTFETDEFSVYTLIYDIPKTDDQDNNDGSNQEKGTINKEGVATGDQSESIKYVTWLLSSCSLLLIMKLKKS